MPTAFPDEVGFEIVNGFLFNILNRPGDDLLFRALRRSTIGTIWFHFRVRDGTGWDTNVMITRSIKDIGLLILFDFRERYPRISHFSFTFPTGAPPKTLVV